MRHVGWTMLDSTTIVRSCQEACHRWKCCAGYFRVGRIFVTCLGHVVDDVEASFRKAIRRNVSKKYINMDVFGKEVVKRPKPRSLQFEITRRLRLPLDIFHHVQIIACPSVTARPRSNFTYPYSEFRRPCQHWKARHYLRCCYSGLCVAEWRNYRRLWRNGNHRLDSRSIHCGC